MTLTLDPVSALGLRLIQAPADFLTYAAHKNILLSWIIDKTELA